jgi:hypothetical protein
MVASCESPCTTAHAGFDFSEDDICGNVFGGRRHSVGRCNLGDAGFAPRYDERPCPDGQRLLIFDVEAGHMHLLNRAGASLGGQRLSDEPSPFVDIKFHRTVVSHF